MFYDQILRVLKKMQWLYIYQKLKLIQPLQSWQHVKQNKTYENYNIFFENR